MSAVGTVGQIEELVSSYFKGLFEGDLARLRAVFHPGAILSGEIRGAPYYKTLDAYLEGVGQRKSPRDEGEEFRMQLLSVNRVGLTAVATAHCPMLGLNYYDVLSLVRKEDGWVIAAKVFSHVEQ